MTPKNPPPGPRQGNAEAWEQHVPSVDEVNLEFVAPFSGMAEMYALQKGLEIGTAAGYSAGEKSPRVLELIEALKKIAFTQDTAPEDPLGGPCRMALSESRNRRINEAREALSAFHEEPDGK